MRTSAFAIVVMGAAGAGKTTVGTALARELGWRFIEADEFHTAFNVEKMRKGIGLTDENREPWLGAVRDAIRRATSDGQSVVVACSALKHRYRQTLAASGADVRYVYLRADEALLRQRVAHRTAHFAGAALIATQARDLEPPGDEALTLDASQPPQVLVSAIRDAWDL